ncbi:VWA domain-containing protein [candidate division CSSED10-310 bacterium]|uniref:VWA domain-containing protein n=1 Tax=candidate division CSSED10-310 bacterium TaxID=2855610 RepID=A0ABV6Z4G9_UNCC1
MFLDFFYYLRERGLNVSTTEWLSVIEALLAGFAKESLDQFYILCRALCIKSENYFDLYDQCFEEFFDNTPLPENVNEAIITWLQQIQLPSSVASSADNLLTSLDLTGLKQELLERLKDQEQLFEDGHELIGTGGTSPFGQGGQHPAGIQLSRNKSSGTAVQVAQKRLFKNLRSDRILETRQIGLALKKLRKYCREGLEEELDLDETIKASAINAGDISLIFRPERKNRVKIILLIDVGGSMSPYTELCERLFSAAYSARHFRSFKHFFFHNCPYETVYSDIERRKGQDLATVLKTVDHSWFCIIIGDAAMAPSELTIPGGAIDYFLHNRESGLVWLQRIRKRMPKSVWINPDPPQYWKCETLSLIQDVYPMFPLTLDGIGQAMQYLTGKK